MHPFAIKPSHSPCILRPFVLVRSQWRGRDPECGLVALKLDNIQASQVLPRVCILTLIGWTTLGDRVLPIVANDYHPDYSKKKRHGRLTIVGHLYCIPCVKHMVAIFTTIVRLVMSVPFAVGEPRAPLNAYDYGVILFFLSALHHELRQMKKQGVRDYFDSNLNQLDMGFLAISFIGIIFRIGLSLASACPREFSNGTVIVEASATDGDLDFPSPFGDVSCFRAVQEDDSTVNSLGWNWDLFWDLRAVPSLPPRDESIGAFALTLVYRITMAIFSVVQVSYLTSLMSAFETYDPVCDEPWTCPACSRC